MSMLQDDPPRARTDPVRREGIIRTAHAAFLADGYAATSMSSIAAKVGGSKGTLYNYFTSKEELFVAVVETKCEEKFAYIYDGGLDAMPFREALHAIAARFLGFVLSDEAIATYRLVTAESARFPNLGRALYEKGFQAGIGNFADYLARAVAAADMRDADLRLAAEQFFELCKSGMHHRRLFNVMPPPSAAEIDAQVATAVALFIRAYGTPESDAPPGGQDG